MVEKIRICTDDNSRAAALLDFYELLQDDIRKYIIVRYEDVDQIPLIHRLLENHGIGIQEISLV